MKILKIIFFPITIVVYFFKFIINKFKRLYIKGFLKKCTITKIDTLTGTEFEDLCKIIFEYCGYKVEKTPTSNDYGADLVLTKKLKIVVQCKLYYNHGVGNKAVQEVTSALKFYKAHFAVVMTNWTYTKQAKNMASIQNVVLIDRDDIEQFLIDVKENKKRSKIFDLQGNFKVNALNLD